jgi:hypothetical protein
MTAAKKTPDIKHQGHKMALVFYVKKFLTSQQIGGFFGVSPKLIIKLQKST